MHYTMKTKNAHGAVHTTFIYLDQVIQKTDKKFGKSNNYIDDRTKYLDGLTIKEALSSYVLNDKNVLTRYTISDLKYDIKIGRIKII